ncbi:ASTRA-associated protein 1 [Smittium mucronatum]|uniref:ASTRA-associated protein 1 n=1 Tax=Smittium mucronatum TaxID=133383 RepID=A0A1R0GZ32_9FUNG|nr:ASTRA-associated protein 1 [Smittium mucronatum]
MITRNLIIFYILKQVSDLVATIDLPHIGVNSIEFSPDSKYLAAGCWDYRIRLISTAQWTVVSTFKFHTNPVSSITFIPPGPSLHPFNALTSNTHLSAAVDGTMVTDTNDSTDMGDGGSNSRLVRSGRNISARSVRDFKNYWFVAASYDNRISLWDKTK